MPETAVPQSIFYKSVVLINGTAYSILPNGTRISAPKNYSIPPIIGNYWQFNFGAGLRQAVVDVAFVPLDSTTGVISDTFLNYALTRTNDTSHDTSVIGPIAFWNGRDGFTLTNAKMESFSISSSKGQPISFSARFVGGQLLPIGAYSSPFTTWDSSTYTTTQMQQSRLPILQFMSVNFLGGLANVVWSFNLTFSNNHTPNIPLDGSEWPIAQNAGMQTVAFNCMVQAATLKAVDINYNSSYGTVPDNSPATGAPDNTVPGSLTTIQFTITGATMGAVTFTLNNPVDQTPDEHDVQAPRLMRSHQYSCLGGGANGQALAPLVMS
jgi:hypothetical protein